MRKKKSEEWNERKVVKGEKIKEQESSISGSVGDNNKEPIVIAKPIGEPVRVSGNGFTRRDHFKSFEYDGATFELEDTVLLVPEDIMGRPCVRLIKDISQTKDGRVMVTGQCFYHPEQVERKEGGNWESSNKRELFYSFHIDEVRAESVIHKCVVHFIPPNKQIPRCKQCPGLIVQYVYDTEQKRLFKLTERVYEDAKQDEINLFVQKTMSRLGELLNIERQESFGEHEEHNKRVFRK